MSAPFFRPLLVSIAGRCGLHLTLAAWVVVLRSLFHFATLDGLNLHHITYKHQGDLSEAVDKSFWCLYNSEIARSSSVFTSYLDLEMV
jgi:hypothetical protein